MMKNLVEENMSNLTSASGEAISASASASSNNGGIYSPNPFLNHLPQPQTIKRKRSQPGHPDPDSEVISLSPRSLLATNRFVCEVCNKGFQRDQNLQLHRRGHNLPWKLKQRNKEEVVRKKVYVCPEISCVHHDPLRALGDLTGIKKHFSRKHGEKKWKCDKCAKKYAVQSDWKAHSKTCGTREYRCDCGTLFSRRDSFITHRAFCDALAEESAKSITPPNTNTNIIFQPHESPGPGGPGPGNSISHLHHMNFQHLQSQFQFQQIKKEQQNFNTTLRPEIPPWLSYSCPQQQPIMVPGPPLPIFQNFQENQEFTQNPNYGPTPIPPPSLSATALLQKASQMGAKSSSSSSPAGSTAVFVGAHVSESESGQHHHSFGLNLSYSRDQFMINGLSSYGNGNNKAAAGAGAPGDNNNNNNPSSSASCLLHDMMMNSNHPLSGAPGFDNGGQGSTFDDFVFGTTGFKKDDNFRATMGEFRNSGGVENGDGMMTRDFLGLRPLSQSDILSITGSMNNHSGGNENQEYKSWQA